MQLQNTLLIILMLWVKTYKTQEDFTGRITTAVQPREIHKCYLQKDKEIEIGLKIEMELIVQAITIAKQLKQATKKIKPKTKGLTLHNANMLEERINRQIQKLENSVYGYCTTEKTNTTRSKREALVELMYDGILYNLKNNQNNNQKRTVTMPGAQGAVVNVEVRDNKMLSTNLQEAIKLIANLTISNFKETSTIMNIEMMVTRLEGSTNEVTDTIMKVRNGQRPNYNRILGGTVMEKLKVTIDRRFPEKKRTLYWPKF